MNGEPGCTCDYSYTCPQCEAKRLAFAHEQQLKEVCEAVGEIRNDIKRLMGAVRRLAREAGIEVGIDE